MGISISLLLGTKIFQKVT